MSKKIKHKIEAEGGELIQSNQPIKVKRGGMAVPLGNGFSLLKGRKHSQGGIDIDLQDDARIWSSVPFLSGLSPAERVLDGENPDKVFAQQESYKDKYGIKDDGSKAKNGKNVKKKGNVVRTEEDKNVDAWNRAVYSEFNPLENYPSISNGIARYIKTKIKSIINPDDMNYAVTDSTADNYWRYRLGLSVNPKYFGEMLDDGTITLPKYIEDRIPIDTTAIKNRIEVNKEWRRNSKKGTQRANILDWAIRTDQNTLDSLRHTYKTGEPVVINEGTYNGRQLIDKGEVVFPEEMPLNMLKDYTIQYDKDDNVMRYRDVYDFDNKKVFGVSMEKFVPGEPYVINGAIDLNKRKQMGGDINKNGLIYNLNGNVVQGLGYIPSTGRRQKAALGKWIVNGFKNIKDYAKTNPDEFNDYLSAGINTVGTVGSYLINENMLDDISLPKAPISKQAIKLKTNYNINPQLDAAREAENRTISDINDNTTSSNVALARINQARFANMLNTNTLYGNKENVETELINQDRQNQQNVLNSNIDSYNQYTKELIAVQNQINESRSENLISGINNIAQGFQDIISRREQRKQDNNTKWLHMISAPNAPEIPADFWNWNEDKKMQWWKNKNKGAFGNDGVFYTNEDINKMSRIERKRLNL